MRATWYVLEDGAVVDPNDVGPDTDGVLRHKSGVAVAMRGEVPVSRGVDLDDADEKQPGKKGVTPKDRELKAGKGRVKYETR